MTDGAGRGPGDTASGAPSDDAPSPPTPPTPQEAKAAVREALERFARGESEVEEVVDPSGAVLRLERDPDDPRGYVMKAGAGPEGVLAGTDGPPGADERWVPRVEGIRFPAAPTRPDGFPDDMPFVPEAVAVLNLHLATGARVLRWEELTYAHDWKKQIVAALRESGWGDPETDPPDAVHASEVRFRLEAPAGTPGAAGPDAAGVILRRVLLVDADHHRGDLMVVEEGEG